MKVLFASDHAGFELKAKLTEFVKDLGHEVEDMGPFKYDALDDYPDFVSKAATLVANDPEERRAIIIGMSGQGEAMVANRFRHVRAAVYNAPNLQVVRLSREHNDSNVLSIGAGMLSEEEAEEAVKVWLETPFTGEERHIRRIEKLDDYPN